MMHLYDANEGILDRCCFAEISPCAHVYGTGMHSSWAISKASLNSSVQVTCSGGQAPYWGGRTKSTFFFNNSSHLIATSTRSCYCHVRTPQNRDDITCFFSGSSCTGHYPVDFFSDVSGCIITKFIFVNNSDSSGYFRLVNTNIQSTIKESVISFTSTDAKWIYGANTGTGLAIMDTIVIADSEPSGVLFISTTNVQVIDKTSTYSKFQRNPGWKECNPITKLFTHTDILDLLSSFVHASLTTLAVT